MTKIKKKWRKTTEKQIAEAPALKGKEKDNDKLLSLGIIKENVSFIF